MHRLIIVILSLLHFNIWSQQQDGHAILKKMVDKVATIKTMKYSITNKERHFDVIKTSVGETKVCYDPFKFYMKQSKPKEGLEVLYVQGERKNMALINTNGFPWMNLTLNPYGNSMHGGAHHVLFHAGYRFLVKMVNHYVSNTVNKATVTLAPDEKIGNILCYKVIIEMKNYGFITHIVKKGETMHTIAEKYMVNSNSILERNIIIADDYEEVLNEGEKLIVPNSYAKKIILHLDKTNYLPQFIQVYDDQGFYESMEFRNVKINPTFESDEFSEDFDDYGF